MYMYICVTIGQRIISWLLVLSHREGGYSQGKVAKKKLSNCAAHFCGVTPEKSAHLEISLRFMSYVTFMFFDCIKKNIGFGPAHDQLSRQAKLLR